MQNTVTLYKISYLDKPAIGYSIMPYKHDLNSFDDGGSPYILPDGYTVSKNPYGETMIFEDVEGYCHITTSKNDLPLLCSGKKTVELKPENK